MLVVRTDLYPKSVLRYKFLILGTYNLDTLYLREQGCDGPWFLIQAKRSLRPTKFGKHWSKSFYTTPLTVFCTVGSLPSSCKPVLLKAIGTVHFDLISSSVFTCNVFTHGVAFA